MELRWCCVRVTPRASKELRECCLGRQGVKIEAKQLAQRIAHVAKSKKAEKVVILDVSKVAGFCDYFVIAIGNSLSHTISIAQAIQEDLESKKIKSLSKISPNDESGWIALDYVSVISHTFYQPVREFYSLEGLWSDAKRVRVSAPKNAE